MRDRDLYATILGLPSPWVVVEVDLNPKLEMVRVHVAAQDGTQFACPECNQLCPKHDHRQGEWRHLDTCQFRTILVADVPRVRCKEHGVRQIRVPWAEPGSRFTALFEAVVIDWLREASILGVARRMKLSWDEASGIQHRAVKRGLARRESRETPFLGVDETSFRKGHQYVTVVTDLLTGAVLDASDDRKRASLEGFFQKLSTEQLGAIQAVAMDMHKPYVSATKAYVPGAEAKICFDRFHVAKHLGDAVNRVRREEHRDLLARGDRSLTSTRFLWLGNCDGLPASDREALDLLRKSSLRTARAWAMKEHARKLWSYISPVHARRAWKGLVSWLIRSRLEPMKKVGRTIREHLWGIVNAVTQGVTNAGSESVNARIQRVKKMACGFRNKERFRNAILFHLGGLDLYPAHVSVTHTKA